ncbi:hypothetical protein Dimus_006197 [Dionaea muscipula]
MMQTVTSQVAQHLCSSVSFHLKLMKPLIDIDPAVLMRLVTTTPSPGDASSAPNHQSSVGLNGDSSIGANKTHFEIADKAASFCVCFLLCMLLSSVYATIHEQLSSVYVSGIALLIVLTSCGSDEAFQLGRQVHAYTIKANLVESDEFLKTALIDMYCKCDSFVDARKVLDNMIDFSVVSHNAMIEGYSRNQQLYEALDLFQQINLILPNQFASSIALFYPLSMFWRYQFASSYVKGMQCKAAD